MATLRNHLGAPEHEIYQRGWGLQSERGSERRITSALHIALPKCGPGDTQFTRRYVVVEIAWASQIDLNLNHKVATFALSDLEPA